jgi:hypothetical protein
VRDPCPPDRVSQAENHLKAPRPCHGSC